MPWREIPQDTQLEEGDVIKTHYCVQAPEIPFNEVLASLSIEYGRLTGKINEELPGNCLEVRVVNRELERSSGVVVDGDECEFIYTITHEVTHAPEGCDPDLQTASIVTSAVAVALAALVTAFAITLVLHKTEQLLTGEASGPANLLVLAGLVAAVGYASGKIGDATGNDGSLLDQPEKPADESHSASDSA